MSRELSLDELWNAPASGGSALRFDQVSALPDAVRRYLQHAIAPGTQLAYAVRLRMHGEIKLGRWRQFTAEQVIRWDRGMIWSATVRMYGMPIRGSDRLVDGSGALRWRLFGIIPVMNASGPDIDRSAAGRLAGESVWLPSVLSSPGVSWTQPDKSRAWARFSVRGETAELELEVDERGRLETIKLPRWGNPEGGEFDYVDFGGVAEKEESFGGYTIPTQLRVGWYFGTDRFESEGEFFRVTIDDAQYR